MKKQSSLGLPVLPPSRVLLATLLFATAGASHAVAQGRYRLATDENLRVEPNADATLLARVNAQTEVRGGEERDGWVRVTVEGWIWAQSTRAGNRGFDLAVSSSGGENLRAEPNGRVLARLQLGTLLEEVGRRGGWIQVRRSAWMWGRSLTAITPSAAPGSSGATSLGPPGPSVPGAASLDRQALPPGTRLLANPDGDTVGVLGARAPARVLARTNGWARVLVEAWVRENALVPGDDSVLSGITAAEVRGSGGTYVGRTLRWTVELIAVQTADELRRDIPTGARFLLARGPLPEVGFVYVMLTPQQASTIQQLPPLTRLTILGRVRVPRSSYLGNPVLDLVGFAVDEGD